MTARPPTRVVALASVVALLAGAGLAVSKPKPPPKPKPQLELLTTTQEGALRKRAIKVGVFSKRGAEVRAEATLVVEDFPEDFVFKLGPEKSKLRNREATLRFPLSSRKIEVLDFAAMTCESARVSVRATVGRGSGATDGRLKKPPDCGAG